MNEITQEQKLRQLDDILGNAIKLGQEIINNANVSSKMKFECDVKYQNRLAEAYQLIKNITMF